MSYMPEGDRRSLILNGERESQENSSNVAAGVNNDNFPVGFNESERAAIRVKQQPQLDYRTIDPEPSDSPQRSHKARLVMSSRERLDMDTGGSGSLFKRKHGCFVPRWVGGLVVLLFVASLLLVGLLVGYLTPGSKFLQEADNATVLPPPTPEKFHALRLPGHVVPVHYDLRLRPFLAAGPYFNFTFKVSMLITCRQTTNTITVNANNLTLTGLVTLQQVPNDTTKGVILPAPKVLKVDTMDTKNQFWVVHLDGPLVEHARYNLTMEGNATVYESLAGFYKSEYTEGNETKYLAVTQFEPTDARKAFPCFDEPALKATFNVTIIREANLSSISNSESLDNFTRDDGWVEESFKTTPIMSTYLLAFMVSEFETLTSPDGKFRVFARKDVLPTAKYALEKGPQIIGHYNDFFGIPYPLNKTDLAAIPDFNAGAMENWGLITFRETAMLYDPEMSSAGDKQQVATTLAHELGHQWFGNLVTPAWWDDLWLNEGFATYMEYVGSNFIEPTWKMLDQFVLDEVQSTMELDGLKTSHAIYVPVNSPDEINEIFDSISYGKGGSIIRMMEKFLGNATFSQGLSNYLNSTQYGNAVSNDLWHHLTEAQKLSGNQTEAQNGSEIINVTDIMNKWAKQIGFPIVCVVRDYNNSSVFVTQRRFLLDSNNSSESSGVLWDIPLTWAEPSEAPETWTTNTKKWFKTENLTITTFNSTKDQWIIFNVDEVGFYRVNYDMGNWKLILEQLEKDHTKIRMVNRAQILDDSFSLARAGQLSYEVPLNATRYLIKESEYIPWSSALGNLGFINQMLCRSEIYGQFKDYIIHLIKPLYDKYGWGSTRNETVQIQYAQQAAISWACKFGHSDCVQTAIEKFKQWKANPKDTSIIDPNLRGTVYCTGVAEGNFSDWTAVWDQYVHQVVPSEKKRLMRALSCSKEPWILYRYLGFSLNSTKGIRNQDGMTVISQVGSSDYGRELTFSFLRDKWTTLFQIYGLTTFTLAEAVHSMGSRLNTQFELDELKYFWKKVELDNTGGTAKRAFSQALETAQANVNFMHLYYDNITNWLQDFQSSNVIKMQ